MASSLAVFTVLALVSDTVFESTVESSTHVLCNRQVSSSAPGAIHKCNTAPEAPHSTTGTGFHPITSASQVAVEPDDIRGPGISVSDTGPFTLIEGRIDQSVTFTLPEIFAFSPRVELQLGLDGGATLNDIVVYEGVDSPDPDSASPVFIHPLFFLHTYFTVDFETITFWFVANDDEESESGESFTAQLKFNDGNNTLALSPVLRFDLSDPITSTAPQFTEGATSTRAVSENTPRGHDIGEPVTATDADGDIPTHTLGGADAAAFTIATTTGQLITSAALDHETRSSYSVTVTADDGHGGTGSIDVTIDVTNVDEPGAVTVSGANAPFAGLDLTASLSDPDGGITNTMWQWERAEDSVTPVWADIGGATSTIYTPTGDDVGKILRAAATYMDLFGAASAASPASVVVSSLPVVTVSDSGPFSLIEGRVDRSIEFSLPADTVATAQVTLRLSLRGATSVDDLAVYSGVLAPVPGTSEPLSFGTVAQVSVSDVSEPITLWFVALSDSDTEAGESFTVRMEVEDAGRLVARSPLLRFDLLDSTSPRFTEGDATTRSVAENSSVGSNVGDPVTAADADGDEPTYTVGGTDGNAFTVDADSGQLMTSAELDHETRSSYSVTVTADDGHGGTGSIVVTIEVTNVDEPGTASLSGANPPFVGVELSASVSDPDEPLTNTVWQWQRAEDTASPMWTDISGATSSTYTPSNNDRGKLLRATVSYHDPFGDNAIFSPRTAAVSDLPVITVSDTGPFTLVEGRIDRYVTFTLPDVSELSTRVELHISLEGSTVLDDIVVYEGVDSPDPDSASPVFIHPLFFLHTYFTVDFETITFWFVAKADGESESGESFTAQLEFNDGDIPLARSPVLRFNLIDSTSPQFPEGATTTRAVSENTPRGHDIGRPILATDADGDIPTHTLGGADALSFTIATTTGQLVTSAELDYETRLSYSVTVTANDGHGGTGSIDVVIDVTNVDEPGIVTVSGANAPFVGSDLTASLSDPDGEVTVESWQWQRADEGVTPVWADIGGATSTIYTPTGDDVGKILRASVTYTDLFGVASAESPASVIVSSLPVVTVSDSGPFSLIEGRVHQSVAFSLPADTVATAQVTLRLSLRGATSVDDLAVYSGVLAPVPGTSEPLSFGTVAQVSVSDVSEPITLWFVALSDSGTEAGESFTVRMEVEDDGRLVGRSPVLRFDLVDSTSPQFSEGATTTRAVSENAPAGNDIGDPVTAADADGDEPTYTLAGPEAESFAIATTTGQLVTSAELDYETRSSYSVTVTANDGHGGTGSIVVTIEVRNVDEPGTVALSGANPPFVGVELSVSLSDPDEPLTNAAWQWQRADEGATPTWTDISGATSNVYTPSADDKGKVLRAAVSYTDHFGYNTISSPQTVTVSNLPVVTVSDAGPFALIEGRIDRSVTFTLPDVSTPSTRLALQLGLDGGATLDDIVVYVEDQIPGSSSTSTLSFHPITLRGYHRPGFFNQPITFWFVGKEDGESESGEFITIHMDVEDGNTLLARSPVLRFNLRDSTSPQFVDGDSTVRAVLENTPAGGNVGPPILATDADGDTLTYKVGGADAAAFTIATTTGQLVTSAALDYETRSSYSVTVTADDGYGGTGSIDVIIEVTNVDEPGVVTVSGANAPFVGSDLAASLSDPDEPLANTVWQWERAEDSVTPVWTGIGGATSTIYTPTEDDVGKVLRVAVTYTDLFGDASAASPTSVVVSSLPVVTVSDSGPFRLIEGRVERSIEFSLPADTVATAQVTLRLSLRGATSVDDLAVYSGADAPVPGSSEQLALDADDLTVPIPVTDVSQTLTLWFVAVADTAADVSESFTVRMEVEDTGRLVARSPLLRFDLLDSTSPRFTEGDATTRSVAENSSVGSNVGNPVTATDADGDEPTYTLAGPGADSFAIATTTGQLVTSAALDHETRSSYSVTVTADDGHGGTGSIVVTIEVTNVDEPGTVALSGANPPFVDVEMSVSLSDPDEPLTNTVWQWQRADEGATPSWSDIRGATSRTYTPSNDDRGKVLRVAVSYTDAFGGKTVTSRDSAAVSDLPAVTVSSAGPFTLVEGRIDRSVTFTLPDVSTPSTRLALQLGLDGATTLDDIVVYVEDQIPGSISTSTLSFHPITLRGYHRPGFFNQPITFWFVGKEDGESESGESITVHMDVEDGDDLMARSPELRFNLKDSTSPQFVDGDATVRAVLENTPSGNNIGRPILATDADGDIPAHTLGGADATSFTIATTTGQLVTSAELDYETRSSYSVTVTADDGHGGTDSIDVTIDVTNVSEPPGEPAPPAVAAIGVGALFVSWTEPFNTGPPVADYEVRLRKSGDTGWRRPTQTETTTQTTISGLQRGTEFHVQVRARNTEGLSKWSGEGSGSTHPNREPEFTSGTSTPRTVVENTPAGVEIGEPLSASDADEDTVIYLLAGQSAVWFAIDGRGQLRTADVLDYEEQDTHRLTVVASDQVGGVTSVEVPISVTDVDEPPADPEPPTVMPAAVGGHTALDVRWQAPENTGPPISDYLVQHRLVDAGEWSLTSLDGSTTEATISGLHLETRYQVRLRVVNAEGASGWSSATLATTDPNGRPVFPDGETTGRSIGTDVDAGSSVGDPITATDPNGDTLRYTLSGPDSSVFRIDPTTGQLTTVAEMKVNKQSSFEVIVRATDPFGGFTITKVIITAESDDDIPGIRPISRGVAQPTSTPVPIIVVPVSQVTPVPHAQSDIAALAIVHPDAQRQIELAQQGVLVTFPAASRGRTFQVRVDTASDRCSGTNRPGGTVLKCVSVDLFDIEGNPENDIRLIRLARMTIRLDSTIIRELGGPAAALQARALGAFRLFVRHDPDRPWSNRGFEFEISQASGATFAVDGIRHFSTWSLTVDDELLAVASAQVMAGHPSPTATALQGVTPTPTPSRPDTRTTPLPMTSTPIAAPTVTPTPQPPIAMSAQPTSTPGPSVPDTGGSSAPVSILVILALAGALLSAIGLRQIHN